MNSAKYMKLNQLGRGGPMVSKYGLGTMTFGAETNETEAFRQLDCFVDHEGTFIDTADVYNAGMSEEIIGKWGRQRGSLDDLIIATKGRFLPPPGSAGCSRRSITRSVNASLRRLQIDAIDVYFIHGWDEQTAIADTLGILNDLISLGKIHHVAWSNVTGWQLQKILLTATSQNLAHPVALQPQYNLLDRGIEMEVLPCCLENNISITPWSPLGGGWLTDKYKRDTPPKGKNRLGENPDRGVEAYDIRNTPKTHKILAVLERIAQQHGRPPAHIALAWLASRPGVASILLGARTNAQLKDNLSSADCELSMTEQEELTAISAGGLPDYPYRFVEEWGSVKVWQQLGT